MHDRNGVNETTNVGYDAIIASHLGTIKRSSTLLLLKETLPKSFNVLHTLETVTVLAKKAN